jgi:hypothetical protein
MTAFVFSFPAGSVVTGEILRDYSAFPQRLTPDIMQVMLPSGYGIDVGWLPAFDPGGTFQIVVFKGVWDNQVMEPIETSTPDEAARLVESLAREYMEEGRRPPQPLKMERWKA